VYSRDTGRGLTCFRIRFGSGDELQILGVLRVGLENKPKEFRLTDHDPATKLCDILRVTKRISWVRDKFHLTRFAMKQNTVSRSNLFSRLIL
jgi:hypothetical protein